MSPTCLVCPRHQALWPAVAHATLHGDDAPGRDLAHGLDHVLRVYRWAVYLAPEEPGADVDLVGAAALVHDLVHVPKHLAQRPLGSALSAEAARGLLPEAGYSPDEIDAVVDAVATCSWSRGLAARSPEGRVLQDADRIDALGAIGALRNAAVAQAMASAQGARSTGEVERALVHPTDPLAEHRPLNDHRFALDHYAVKLLQLQRTLHTPSAQAEGARRHARLVALRDALVQETGPPGAGRAG